MKRKMFLLNIFLLLALLLAACTTNEVAETSETEEAAEVTEEVEEAVEETEEVIETEEAEAEVIKIGISLMHSDEFNVKLAVYYQEYADTLDNVEVTIIHANADANKQLTDVETLIAQGIDVLILRAVDPDASIPAAEAAKEAGIYVVMDQTSLNSDIYDVRVAGDQIDVGKAIGDYICQYLAEDESNVVNMGYIHGGTSETIVKRETGIYETCPQSDRFQTIITGNAAWSLDDAMAMAEDWLMAYPEINAIACANDEMASGVVQALKAAGVELDEFLVMGVDGTDVGQEMIRAGELDATTYQDIPALAQACIDVAIRLLNGETVDKLVNPRNIELMTVDNIDEILAGE